MYVLKDAQINLQNSLIREFILYKFEIGHNAVEASKDSCGAKGEGLVDHRTVSRSLNKLCSGCKKLDDQEGSSWTKTVVSKAVLLAIEPNPASTTRRVSGELAQHLTVQRCSRHRKKHLELPNCDSRYQNIANVCYLLVF